MIFEVSIIKGSCVQTLFLRIHICYCCANGRHKFLLVNCIYSGFNKTVIEDWSINHHGPPRSSLHNIQKYDVMPGDKIMNTSWKAHTYIKTEQLSSIYNKDKIMKVSYSTTYICWPVQLHGWWIVNICKIKYLKLITKSGN